MQYMLAVPVVLGFAGTVLAIVMSEIGNNDASWHFLIGLIGIPTALGAASIAFLQAVKG